MSITGHSIKKIPKKKIVNNRVDNGVPLTGFTYAPHGDMAFKTQTRILKGGYRP